MQHDIVLPGFSQEDTTVVAEGWDEEILCEPPSAVYTAEGRRANELDGATWTRYSISIWSDIRFDSGEEADVHIITDDARNLRRHVHKESIDLVVTSPPYWDILLEKRTADYKPIRHYGDAEQDLGKIDDYYQFLTELQGIFTQVYEVLRQGGYCCVVVMDIRKKGKFYPYHADFAVKMQEIGFEWDDLIIWDRRQEYNNLRPLGYPSVFRINKVHEFILIFQKR